MVKNAFPVIYKKVLEQFRFQVILGICLSWLIGYILTVTDVLPPDSTQWGHVARTDVKSDVIWKAAWFRFPYPCKKANKKKLPPYCLLHHSYIY